MWAPHEAPFTAACSSVKVVTVVGGWVGVGYTGCQQLTGRVGSTAAAGSGGRPVGAALHRFGRATSATDIRVVGAAIAPTPAPIMDVPMVRAAAKPELAMVVTAGLKEVHVAIEVSSWLEPSE